MIAALEVSREVDLDVSEKSCRNRRNPVCCLRDCKRRTRYAEIHKNLDDVEPDRDIW